ncbi:MAG TPA: SDR family NAD(P)-dependent oxidoreductase, partial [Spirillospora sp.]|nr:SDR family NAD(P)-dependent oxidoreductase [Spirillospora sp.]
AIAGGQPLVPMLVRRGPGPAAAAATGGGAAAIDPADVVAFVAFVAWTRTPSQESIILANAGLAAAGDAIEKMSEKLWRDSIDVNLTGVWQTVKAAVPHVIEGGRGGAIVLTSSVGGLKSHPNIGTYIASKHGVVGLMRSMAVEFAQHGIRVNSVHPTQVNSPMLMNDMSYRMFRPTWRTRPPRTWRRSRR